MRLFANLVLVSLIGYILIRFIEKFPFGAMEVDAWFGQHFDVLLWFLAPPLLLLFYQVLMDMGRIEQVFYFLTSLGLAAFYIDNPMRAFVHAVADVLAGNKVDESMIAFLYSAIVVILFFLFRPRRKKGEEQKYLGRKGQIKLK